MIHCASAAHALPVEIRLYDRLFSVPNLGAGGRFPRSDQPGIAGDQTGVRGAEPGAAEAGKAYQFEREGYFCLDSRYATATNLVFNRTVVGCVIPGRKRANNISSVSVAPSGAFFVSESAN